MEPWRRVGPESKGGGGSRGAAAGPLMEEEGRVRASLDGSVLKNPPAMQESQESLVQSLGQQDPPEEGLTTLLQYSCLGNPRDRRALQATVHRVAKSRTRLK